jgi:hypothetical protein
MVMSVWLTEGGNCFANDKRKNKGEKEIKRYHVQGCKNIFTLYGIIF